MSLTLAAILAESATRYPDRDAVVIGPQRITYAALWEQTRRYAAVLGEAGVGPGDRVALLMPNVPDFPRAYYAILSLGAVVVPVHALLVAREIGFVLTDSRAKMLIAGGPLLAQGAAGRRAGRGDPAGRDGRRGRRPAGPAGRRGRADRQPTSNGNRTTRPSSSTRPAPPAARRAPC